MKDIIVITGASSGMGKEFAKCISKKIDADEIWIISRSEKYLKKTADEIQTNSKIIKLGLSVKTELEKYKIMLAEVEYNILLLANCAGFGKINHYENVDLETYMNMIDLNIKGYVSMINYSLLYMKKGAKIINIVSSSAFQPVPYVNVYAATKAFLYSYSRALRNELKYREISVTAICPFWVNTPFFNRAINKDYKQVIINYGRIYNPEKVMVKATKAVLNNKAVSFYGIYNKLQIFAAKIFPTSLVLAIWNNREKFNGTPEIRD